MATRSAVAGGGQDRVGLQGVLPAVFLVDDGGAGLAVTDLADVRTDDDLDAFVHQDLLGDGDGDGDVVVHEAEDLRGCLEHGDLGSELVVDRGKFQAEPGAAALEALRELKLRGAAVAVMLADYRMPQMNGVEFLEEALDLFPFPGRPPTGRNTWRR